MRGALLAALAALAACGGQEGTLLLEIAEPPDSGLIAAIQRLRVTTTNPAAVFEAQRTANGLDLSVELPGGTANGIITIEGFDATDTLLASGQSPPFSLTGVDTHVVVYLAPPLSITSSHQMLQNSRSDVAAIELPYGAVLAGGRTDAGDLSDTIQVYNAYDHSLLFGNPMPVQRAGQGLGIDDSGNVYLFGGIGPEGTATGSLHLFQTAVSNGGAYYEAASAAAGQERSDALVLRVATGEWLITGAIPLRLTSAGFEARSDLAALTNAGVAGPPDATGARTVLALRDDGSLTDRADATVLVTPTGVSTLDLPALAGRAGTRAAILPANRFLVVGDATTAVVVEAGAASELPDALSVPRIGPSVATTSRHVVIAGGVDTAGTVIPSADIIDVYSLERIATIPYGGAPGAVAIAMPNDQVLLISGDTPTSQLLLFTPPIPPQQPL